MRIPFMVDVAGVMAGLGAALGTVLLVRSARARTRAWRKAYHLLALGVAVAAVMVAGPVAVLSIGPGGDQRPDLVAEVAATGITLSMVVLGAGLLRLSGAADTGPAVLRLLLDGLVIASALWFVGFVALSAPTRLLGAATPPERPTTLLAAVAVVFTAGLTSAVALRSAGPRGGLRLIGFGISVTGVGSLVLVAGISQSVPAPTLIGAGALAVGPLLVATAARAADEAGPQQFDLVWRGTGYAFVSMAAMTLAAVYHLLVDGRFRVAGVLPWIVAGFALVTRQYLALRDVQGIAGQLLEREAHFRTLAHTDPLTGLANRRGLLRALSQDGPGTTAALLYVDLDGFKNVNDLRGHDAGDAVLREAAARLAAHLQPGQLAAHLGGDEFAVLIWDGPAEARRMADILLESLSRPYPHPNGAIFLSASIGLASGVRPVDDPEELLRNADLAQRFAKQQGKGRVEPYDIAYDQWLRRRITLEHDLREAPERGELRLAFQPVAALPSVRPVGAEALLRWRHPTLGEVRPDEFIPLAEECGLIAKLGTWVLGQACQQLSRWLAAGHDVWVSVNVSPRELHAPDYVRQVTQALQTYRVPPQRLVLEVTEHAVATDLDELVRRLTALRATGVRIALDDFGSGYSSLAQLRRLPIDILKIDHGLVSEPVRPTASAGHADASMVDVVVLLGHRLGLEVIAEGVTNQSELAAVVDAGCRFGQGQLFGWGVPAEHLEAMLRAAAPMAGWAAQANVPGAQRLTLSNARPVPDPG